MKTLTLRALAMLLSASTAFAIAGFEDTVEFGPLTAGIEQGYHLETIAQWAEAIKRYEDQISNQLQQIQKAKELLDVQNQLRVTIGDWQGVVARAQSIKLQADNLSKNYSANVTNRLVLDYGNPALSQTDPFGRSFVIRPEVITREERIRAVAAEAYKTLQDTDKEATEISAEIADAYKRMTQSGITQQEFEKLNAKVQALQARLNSVAMQRDSAIQMLNAQRNTADVDEDRAAKIAVERQRETDKNITEFLLSVDIDEPQWR